MQLEYHKDTRLYAYQYLSEYMYEYRLFVWNRVSGFRMGRKGVGCKVLLVMLQLLAPYYIKLKFMCIYRWFYRIISIFESEILATGGLNGLLRD